MKIYPKNYRLERGFVKSIPDRTQLHRLRFLHSLEGRRPRRGLSLQPRLVLLTRLAPVEGRTLLQRLLESVSWSRFYESVLAGIRGENLNW
jgi:hypothetical protein